MSNWIDFKQDADTGIESVRAHFVGHAYDPHWHDSFLVGVTEQGVQQFNCRRVRHRSTPGQVFLLEPGDIHDGLAPTEEGFTYSTLYLEPAWLDQQLRALYEHAPGDSCPGSPTPCATTNAWHGPPPWPSGPCMTRTCASSGKRPWTICWLA